MYSLYPTIPNVFSTPLNVGATQPTQTIQYVNGLPAVEQVSMPPNTSSVFLDNNGKDMYIKQMDANGTATIKVYDYKEKQKEKPKEYVTREEFERFKANLKDGVKHEPNTTKNRE